MYSERFHREISLHLRFGYLKTFCKLSFSFACGSEYAHFSRPFVKAAAFARREGSLKILGPGPVEQNHNDSLVFESISFKKRSYEDELAF